MHAVCKVCVYYLYIEAPVASPYHTGSTECDPPIMTKQFILAVCVYYIGSVPSITALMTQHGKGH